MVVVFWNLRGLKRQKAKDKLYSLVKTNNPSLVWVVEPKIKVQKSGMKLPGMHHKIIHNSKDNNKGNIWLFWNCSIQAPIVIQSSSQCITVEVGGVLVTGIHANSYTVNRRDLWKDLYETSLLEKPWLLIGDFNIVLNADEKKGGRSPLNSAMSDFNDSVDACGLIQAPKSGLEFSWCNGRAGNKRILCNLDRALFNLKWLDSFSGWHYHVAARGISDHGPLIGSDTLIGRALNTPFRFQQMWLTHLSSLKVVIDSWNEDITGNPIFIFMNKLKRLKKVLKTWKWEIFGNVQENLKKVEDKVMEETIKSDVDPANISLLNNLVTARGNYEIDANNYNTFLRDKSRTNWIKDGDVNTKFFHTSIKMRQAQNTISELENDSGDITTTQQVDNLYLEECPNEEEIKRVVFNLNADSAPGPDGFTRIFYRAAWEIIKGNFLEAIQFCWRNNIIPSGMNSKFLVLIPKIKGAKTAQCFRPIGLSNFCFKIITKIITERITSYLPNLVSQQQYAFVKNRNIHEQILLASGLVNEMSTIRRGGNSLKKIGFSAKLCNWIMVLLQSAKLSIMLNGGPIGFFGVGRGLKQGDPLSPILFILAQDVLSRKIHQLVMERKIQPMAIRNGIHPTHLMFADDIFFFCNGGKKSIEHLKTLLMEYQAASGQIFNASKSKCFVDGTSETRKRQIATYFQTGLSAFPEKYLGVFLTQGKMKSIHIRYLVDYMHLRLALWSGKILNFQARLTLVNHVMSSIEKAGV
ncbi:uncharacterized protein LOC113290895 [Papaver somniferum]|uniref:uncharacterized protein LOC113290895 n=1 Tax=Papaver somniferum TaxID=3469 RepID=UPI000E6F5E2C|nr:uncharacterized protein LOC113290895 [Papaver somniferum]